MPYLGTQRFRTPRSLDLIKKRVGDGDHNATLELMGRLFQLHTTVWTDGIWEIVRARKSQTKFIVTDDPVAFYKALKLHETICEKGFGRLGTANSANGNWARNRTCCTRSVTR